MSGYWPPSAPGLDPDDYSQGQQPAKNDATGKFEPVSVVGERLVQDGESPPVDLTLEDESDYLYEDI